MRETTTCQQVREGLREYLDAAGPPGSRATIERHLTGCLECRHELETLTRTLRLLSALPQPRMPAAMKTALLEAFRGRPSA